ncbi:MAG: hypothetical protein EON55_18495 [Alphaproteobacteria bacterium]|nr:MAG: hypothetical protein EON55_18495 [Alphaproteobacteria bacterium]
MSSTAGADCVRAALQELAGASDLESSEASYDRMLDAIGHNHSGSLHRSALPAVDDLLAIACTGRAWSADAALDVLIEITTSFELKFEVARDHTDVQRFKRSLIAAVATRRDEIARLATTASQQRTRARGAELGAALSDAGIDP